MHNDKTASEMFNVQSKSVKITENGTTTITADAGYGSMDKVNVTVEVAGSGDGPALEGDYYLAKPTGRYWKFTCADTHLQGGVHIPYVDLDEFTEEEITNLYNTFQLIPAITYSVVCASSGMPANGSYIVSKSFIEALIRVYEDGIALSKSNHDYGYIIGAFQECTGELEGIKFNGLIDIIQTMLLMTEGIEISEEEAIAMIHDVFMLEQITKEEFESYYNW